MAERKREETKVRCTLAEKTAWQRQWELDGAESLSDWLRTLANDAVRVGYAREELAREASAPQSSAPAPVRPGLTPVTELLDADDLAVLAEENLRIDGTALLDNAIATLADEDVPTERRTETCPCGRPPFVFCGRHDG